MSRSAPAWPADGTLSEYPLRRRRHMVAVVALTIAFVVAGSAVLAVVGGMTWPTSATVMAAGGAEPPAAVPVGAERVPESAPEGSAVDGAPGVADRTRADAEQGSDGDGPAAGEEPADVPSDEPPSEGGPDDEALDEDPGLTTAQVQELLRDHRFLLGPADGRAGPQTTAAVMAFQRVNGLAVDGVVGPATTAALLEGSAEPELLGGAADRIEIDLDDQLLHLIEGDQRVVTLHVSSGNGERYGSGGGGTARANTPIGDFAVERRIHGVRNAPLGTLYDPLYFHRGFAIHGSPSVPAHPASHGCVRVTIADAAWLIERVPDGMPVHLHGGTHVFTP